MKKTDALVKLIEEITDKDVLEVACGNENY